MTEEKNSHQQFVDALFEIYNQTKLDDYTKIKLLDVVTQEIARQLHESVMTALQVTENKQEEKPKGIVEKAIENGKQIKKERKSTEGSTAYEEPEIPVNVSPPKKQVKENNVEDALVEDEEEIDEEEELPTIEKPITSAKALFKKPVPEKTADVDFDD